MNNPSEHTPSRTIIRPEERKNNIDFSDITDPNNVSNNFTVPKVKFSAARRVLKVK